MGRMQGLVRDLIGRLTKHTDSAILGLVLVRVGNLMGEVGIVFFLDSCRLRSRVTATGGPVHRRMGVIRSMVWTSNIIISSGKGTQSGK